MAVMHEPGWGARLGVCCAAAGIELAAKDGIDWILHIDTDELVYPGGGAEYSIQRVLAAVPADVDTLVFPNYESLPERDDVQDPFTEASVLVWRCAETRDTIRA